MEQIINFRKLADLHGHYSAVELIFLDATKSSDTGYRWQTFNGTDLRFLFFRSQLLTEIIKLY